MVTSKRNALLDAGRCAAEILRDTGAQNRIKSGYTRIDPLKIAEMSNVAVMFQPLDKLLGAYINEGRPGIIVNVARPPGLVHMTCAHELGHHFLKHEATTDVQIEYGNSAASVEREADQFAFNLLMPRWLVVATMTRKGWTMATFDKPMAVYQLSLQLGVSYTSMIWTLYRMNLLPQGLANQFLAIKPKQLKAALIGPEDRGAADVWLLDSSDRDVVLEPRDDDVFVLELENKTGNGYVWSVDEIRAAGFNVATPRKNDVRDQPVEKWFGDDPVLGEQSLLNFTVSRRAETVIEYGAKMGFSLVANRPWLQSTEGAQRYSFAAEYERMAAGLGPTEKLRLIEEAKAANA